MHKLTFYPLGNADCCKMDLLNGKKLLFDYAHYYDSEYEDDLRADLANLLKEDLEASGRNAFDVVAFTHADDDHIHRFSEFFYLEHAEKYKSEDRVMIKELWVPAAVILEEGLTGEAKILRAEARYRLKEGKGIRVFSRPERLEDWLKEQGLTMVKRKSLITDAGNLVPGFEKSTDGVEFFVHSPFAVHVEDDGALEDRNGCALILHATFDCEGDETKFFIVGDSTYEVLSDIVNITRGHKREERLQWDIYDIPHHCSYSALSDEKGKDKTEPVSEVKWLLEQGLYRGILVSCSKPIPENDADDLPPHRQAANYYKEVAARKSGEFKVTMEHPSETKPKPLIITIDKNAGATIKKTILGSGGIAVSTHAPRAGVHYER